VVPPSSQFYRFPACLRHATAVLFNLPVTVALLRRALMDGYIDSRTFVWVGPVVVVTIIAVIPILIGLGRAAFRPHEAH
jgi:hypothetical protein